MVLRVAVVDPLPLFRHGVIAATTATGYDAEETDDAVSWAAVPERRILVLTVQSLADWVTLDAVCRGAAGNGVIAVLDDPSLLRTCVRSNPVRSRPSRAMHRPPRSALSWTRPRTARA
jgi:hypothetical protein